ncbi:hypothetical protein NUW54_g578 [Trametes sanguinea]|uniref:Uncharacterized protein n=1 Tax=Trametes sanguinea TaxID=158606 RepID=A0ACC1QBX3_9APHY|nr:hypothetical protein NUW54_g578 [Trametes sanguinea]
MMPVADLSDYIDEHAPAFIDRLAQAVAVPRETQCSGQSLGVTTKLADVGKHSVADGLELPLPPIILGRIGDDPQKKTVLVYGHYDVQPAEKSDGWDTNLNPFQFVVDEATRRMFGRGASDDKGPILG